MNRHGQLSREEHETGSAGILPAGRACVHKPLNSLNTETDQTLMNRLRRFSRQDDGAPGVNFAVPIDLLILYFDVCISLRRGIFGLSLVLKVINRAEIRLSSKR
jgi:hypothetical protein